MAKKKPRHTCKRELRSGPVQPGSALHRALEMIANQVAAKLDAAPPPGKTHHSRRRGCKQSDK